MAPERSPPTEVVRRVHYGNFFEYVQPLRGGHISIGIEAAADVQATVQTIRKTVGSPGTMPRM
jgi:hypothetical protein